MSVRSSLISRTGHILSWIMLTVAVLTLIANWRSLDRQTTALEQQATALDRQSMDLQFNTYIRVRQLYDSISQEQNELFQKLYHANRLKQLDEYSEHDRASALDVISHTAYLSEELLDLLTGGMLKDKAREIVENRIFDSLNGLDIITCDLFHSNLPEFLIRMGYVSIPEFLIDKGMPEPLEPIGEMSVVEC